MSNRVSFVIPTLNQGPFLRRCLDSCLAQNVPDAEIIVRDGGSTDGTQDILASYGGVVRWSSEKDAGQADAVNKAVATASGEIIAWINSDDYYAAPEVLCDPLAVLAQDATVDIVYGDGVLVDPEGKPLRKYPSRPMEPLKRMLLHPCSFVNQPAVLFRRDLFQAVGGLNLDYHWTLDYELWLRMFPRARRTVYLPQTLACATVHKDAKSIHGVWKQVREIAQVKRQHTADFPLTIADRFLIWQGNVRNVLYALVLSAGLRY